MHYEKKIAGVLDSPVFLEAANPFSLWSLGFNFFIYKKHK